MADLVKVADEIQDLENQRLGLQVWIAEAAKVGSEKSDTVNHNERLKLAGYIQTGKIGSFWLLSVTLADATLREQITNGSNWKAGVLAVVAREFTPLALAVDAMGGL